MTEERGRRAQSLSLSSDETNNIRMERGGREPERRPAVATQDSGATRARDARAVKRAFYRRLSDPRAA